MSLETPARPLKHVLITGAASGIGRECASKLIQQGVLVSVLDIAKPDFAVSNYAELNLASPESVSSAILSAAKFSEKHGAFDALLNVAGVPPRPNQQAQVLAVNWLGQKQLTMGLVDHISAGGSIVNMASKAGSFWRDNLQQVQDLMALNTPDELDDFFQAHPIDATRAYNLSKETMIVWTMAITGALKKREIRVNSVSPAAVDTGILTDFKNAFGPMVDKNLSLVGRPGNPDEIANVAVFLASPESAWIRGNDIVVDGGMGALVQSSTMELSINDI